VKLCVVINHCITNKSKAKAKRKHNLEAYLRTTYLEIEARKPGVVLDHLRAAGDAAQALRRLQVQQFLDCKMKSKRNEMIVRCMRDANDAHVTC
jgi:hypothetical protein